MNVVCNKTFLHCRALSLHHVAVSEDWHTVDTPSMNAETVSGLEPCSEYDFTVQVLVQGSPPGPISDIVKSRTNTTRKYQGSFVLKGSLWGTKS